MVDSAVIDIGGGNGDYIERISSFFPYMRHMGIDISSDMISVARATHCAGRIDFSASGFSTMSSPRRLTLS